MKKFKLYFRIGQLLPYVLREKYKKLLLTADLGINATVWLGFLVIFNTLLSLAASLIVFIFAWNVLYSLISFLVVFFLFFAITHIFFVLRADANLAFVNNVLPDYISLVVANMRSGLLPEKSLLLSARDEFGILSREIKTAMKRALTGESFISALKRVNKKINSEFLNQIIELVVEGIKSGGELGTLLEGSAENLRSSHMLRKEIRSSVMMYLVLIIIAVGVASPLAYGISIHLTNTITNLFSGLRVDESLLRRSFIKMTGPKVSTNTLISFALVNISIASVMGGLILGMIESGSSKKGIKYIPVLLGLSFISFFIIQSFLKSL